MQPHCRVVTGAEAARRDAAAIAAGTPSRALMQRAGAAAAGEIARRYADRLAGGVLLFAGPGNNGGDAWVVARALAAAGVAVRVVEAAAAKTPDAAAERALALPVLGEQATLDAEGTIGVERVVVDGLLGTGASGAPRGEIARCASLICDLRARGAAVVALDLPTGVDATTGEASEPVVTAELTLTFGSVKRGHLVARGRCGRVVVLDIGLGALAEGPEGDDGAPVLVSDRWVRERLPVIAADAHKGTRKRVAVVGGAPGMAGAVVLAARAAARSGAGMVKCVVAPESVSVVQTAEPGALASSWPTDDESTERDILSWADALAIGPGLGNTKTSRTLVERLLYSFRGPVLLDADALNVFAGDADAMAPLLRGRPVLLTPHPAELARLVGTDVPTVLAERFDVGVKLARRVEGTVLLKGVPTIVSTAVGERIVVAAGTAALAVAGSGDVLSGVAATLLAQTGDALAAAGLAAWAHGRAAELVHERRGVVRGTVLDDVVESLSDVWGHAAVVPTYPVLLELPAVVDA